MHGEAADVLLDFGFGVEVLDVLERAGRDLERVRHGTEDDVLDAGGEGRGAEGFGLAGLDFAAVALVLRCGDEEEMGDGG